MACDDGDRDLSVVAASQELPAITRSWARAVKQLFPRISQKEPRLQHLDFRLLVSRTVRE